MQFKHSKPGKARYTRVPVVVSVAILLFFLTAPCLFSQDSIHLDVYVGFNGAFRLSKSVPLRISIRNEGPGVEGDVFVRTIDEDGNLHGIVHKPVHLPTGARKEIYFLAGLENTSLRLEAGLRSGGVTLYEKPVDLGRRRYTRPLIVVAGRPGSFDFLLHLPAVREGSFPVVYAHPEDLPVQSAGYEGVRIVILHDLPPEDVDRRRVEALTEWTDSGGSLVVSYGGDPGYLGVAEYPLAELLPVVPVGLRIVDSSELPGFALDTPGDPVPVVITAGGGEDIQPVTGARGKGTVVFVPYKADADALGVDPAVRFWSGLLSEHLHGEKDRPVFSGMVKFTEAILGAELHGFPGRHKALPTAAGILLVGIAALRLLRRVRKGYAPVIYGGLILVPTVAVGLLFFFPGKGPEPVAASFSCIRGSSERSFADVRTSVFLFSPIPGTTGVHIPEDAVPVEGDYPYVLRYGDGAVLEHVPLGGWDHGNFIIESTISLPLRYSRDSGSMRIENGGEYNLEDSFICLEDRIISLGDIPAGTEGVGLQEGVPLEPGPQLPPDMLSRLSAPRRRVLEEAFGDPVFLSYLAGSPPVFVGWLENPSFLSCAAGWTHHRQGLVLVTLQAEEIVRER